MTPSHDDDSRGLPVASVALIAVDLDGTLLRSDETIDPRTIDAIAQVRRRGVHVVLATARPPRGIVPTLRRLELDTLQITHNGALIYDASGPRIFHHAPMNAALARNVVAVTRHVAPSVSVGVEVVDKLHMIGRGPVADAKTAGATPPDERRHQVLDQPITKVLMRGDTGLLGDVRLALKTGLPGRIDFGVSHLRLLQIVSHGASKADALVRVARHYHVARESVMAIGDAPNDLSMMKWAGLSVAVKNAWRDVRGAAQFVVPSNDDEGVAVAIERFAL